MTRPRFDDTALNTLADDFQAIARIEAMMDRRPLVTPCSIARPTPGTARRVLGALRLLRR
ncbi:MAG: hypothetical protein Kow0013_15470 [Pararhodobacter sp.]